MQIEKSQEGTGDNHAISALKFKIISEFLAAGWNVLLSDVDIVVVQVRGASNTWQTPRAVCRQAAARLLCCLADQGFGCLSPAGGAWLKMEVTGKGLIWLKHRVGGACPELITLQEAGAQQVSGIVGHVCGLVCTALHERQMRCLHRLACAAAYASMAPGIPRLRSVARPAGKHGIVTAAKMLGVMHVLPQHCSASERLCCQPPSVLCLT